MRHKSLERDETPPFFFDRQEEDEEEEKNMNRTKIDRGKIKQTHAIERPVDNVFKTALTVSSIRPLSTAVQNF